MAFRKTIITVYCKWLNAEVPITYRRRTEEDAIRQFLFKSDAHKLGHIVKIEEIITPTVIDKLWGCLKSKWRSKNNCK